MSRDQTDGSAGKQYASLPEEAASMYTMLQNPRRRLAILAVAQRSDPPHDVRPIAREVTARLNETTLAQARGDDYQSVYVSLIQKHLKQLDQADILRFDDNRKTVSPGPELSVAVRLLNTAATAYSDT